MSLGTCQANVKSPIFHSLPYIVYHNTTQYIIYHNCYFADDEAERKKKKKTRNAGDEVGLTLGSRRFGVENAERVKKTNTMVKKIAITAQPDESYGAKEISIREPKKVTKVLMPLFFSYICSMFLVTFSICADVIYFSCTMFLSLL